MALYPRKIYERTMLKTIIVAGVIIAIMGMYITFLHGIIDELRKNNNELKKQNKKWRYHIRIFRKKSSCKKRR